MPGAQARGQVPQFQNFRYEGDYGHDAAWGWCPGAGQAILPLSNNIAALQAHIDNFTGHDGTGTNNGLKWGLGLLDPSMSSVIAELEAAGTLTLSSEFSGRPYAYDEGRTKKYLIVMTDGNIRYQPRPTANAMQSNGVSAPGVWGQADWGNTPIYSQNGYNYSTARNTLSRHPAESNLATGAERLADEDLRSQQFLALCGKAKENGVRVFTIGFDIDTWDDAYNEMRGCASVPGDFFDVDGLDLYAAFEQILQNIAKLQLTNYTPPPEEGQ